MAMIPPVTRRRQDVEIKVHAGLEADRGAPRVAQDYIRLSSIGKCPRALWALRQGIPEERSPFAPPWGRALMTFSIGHHVENAVVEWLKAAGFEVEEFDENGDQWTVRMPDGIGVGHTDGMIRVDGEWHLLEIKTAKAKKFDELVKADSYEAWSPGYGDQIQGYMGATHDTPEVRSLSNTMVVVVCKDDSRLYSELIRLRPEKYEELKDRARLGLAEVMPDRPPEMKTQYCKACKWCDVNKWCWSALAGVEFDE